MKDALVFDCSEWQVLSEMFPREMEVIIDMMIEAEVELCR